MTDTNAYEHTTSALQKKIDELTVLNRLLRTIANSLDPTEIIDTSLAEIIPVLNPDLAMVFLTEGSNLVLAGHACSGKQADMEERPSHRIGECLYSLAASAGEPIYVSDMQIDARCTCHECQAMGIRSAAIFPFSDHGPVFGILVLAFREMRHFQPEQMFLEALAGHLSTGLKKALLHRSLVRDREAVIDGLAKKEERFRLAMAATSDGLWDLDIANDNGYLNAACYQTLGYEPNEFLMTGEAWRELVHPDDLNRIFQAHTDCIEGKTARFQVEFRAKTKEGSWKWISSRGIVAERNADGKAVRMIGTYVDITERKLREDDLRTSEARIRAIIGNAPFGAHSYDIRPDGSLIFTGYNQAAEQILGIDHESLIGKTIEESFPFLTHTDMPEIYRSVALTGRSRNVDQIVYEGAVIQGVFQVHAFQSGPRSISAFFLDITERKKSEAALQESEQKFRFIVQHAPAIFFMLDWNGIFLMSEGQALARIGLSPGEVVGLSAFDIYRDNPSICSSIRGALNGELARVKNDVNGVVFDSVYAPYFDSTGSLNGVIGVAIDITEQKKLEEQLLRAQKMEAIGTLAGGLAHDFNNLLTNILGYTSLMLYEISETHPHYARLKSIEKQAFSAADLTRQLLGFARGGKYEVLPTDLNELVRSTSEMFGRTRKELSLVFRLQPELHVVEVDRVQIEQVLMNLLVNAWQAMPDGGTIILSTENVVLDTHYCDIHEIKQGAYVTIAITDAGTGMDEETQKRIFEPFFTTKEKGIGTGLGLASAYGIVRNHGGVINVYSEVGHGSTFSVYLPQSDKAVGSEEPVAKGLVAGIGTILLIDDQDIVSEVGAAMLQTLGYDVIVAQNGQEAIQIYAEKQDTIFLVILDMIMPGMSGSETFDRLKQINPDVRVILSSGYSINGKASAIISKGCSGFIQKPFNLSDLSSKIEQVKKM